MTDQTGGLVNIGPVSGLFDVGVVGNLIHIGADGRQFPEQGSVGVGGPGTKLCAHHQLAKHRLHFQAGGVGQLFQVGILGGVQPQGDGFVGVDGGVLLSTHSPFFIRLCETHFGVVLPDSLAFQYSGFHRCRLSLMACSNAAGSEMRSGIFHNFLSSSSRRTTLFWQSSSKHR